MSWHDLEAELELWRKTGRIATFWWRDDDAVTDTPALRRLLALRESLDVPLALAVIPERADDALATRVREGVAILQHGWAHRSHAPDGRPKAELGNDRALEAIATELKQGWATLERLFGDRLLRVMVPPWNRIAPEVKDALPSWGYVGLSSFKPRQKGSLMEANSHVDIVDWSGTRGFVGEGPALDDTIAHLALRRSGAADTDEPTGLLTHHLAHDDACWRFIDELVQRTRSHPAARWVSARDIFGA